MEVLFGIEIGVTFVIVIGYFAAVVGSRLEGPGA